MNGTTRIVSATVKTFSKSANPVMQSPKKVVKPPQTPQATRRTISTTGSTSGVTSVSGAYHHEPGKVPMGVPAVTATIATGLLIGAGISKNIASFLEENELFVPSDDDDDD
ncbi:essential MCU regulator, mitochondrial [Folsomia candida]|uniref:Essential MCU regulator, mitochondrial n=1 Tax=Folsomia candida TaxID=158441 RepID=A0A226D9B9_FOLCA|nr:essential MCU regulator, mitochondrial [Folsomia candida]XP_035715648.1 essential MCU regulator, mitochondrial [Folsomia candida]OXA41809.1 Protein EMRE, mitochondrial [Folsomia candida]